MEINTPESSKFIKDMSNLYSDDFQELVSAPQDGEYAELLDYLELGEIRKLTNNEILKTINESVERAELYASRADDCDRLVELLCRVLIDERGVSLEEE